MVRVAVEVHGWHALESYGLLWVVQLVSRRKESERQILAGPKSADDVLSCPLFSV